MNQYILALSLVLTQRCRDLAWTAQAWLCVKGRHRTACGTLVKLHLEFKIPAFCILVEFWIYGCFKLEFKSRVGGF